MKCPLCNKEGSYYRIKTNEWYCRFCGRVTKGETPPEEVIKKAKEIVREGEK